MVDKKLGGAGLRGQVAGETALCTVGKSGTGLTYRGFDISVLAENASFEEVAFLLLQGYLPNQRELDEYLTRPSKNLRRPTSRREEPGQKAQFVARTFAWFFVATNGFSRVF